MIKSISGALAHKRSELGQKEKGFTLIELLVVVIIIGILAAIAIPIFLGQQAQAKDSAVEAAITNAKTAVVAQLVTGDTLAEVIAAFPAIEAYTESADITVAIAAVGTGFKISGDWTDGGGHAYTITDTGAAKKVAAAAAPPAE